MNKMFCFQCEQTMNGTGCTIQGVCGKKPEVANLQDKLLSSTVKLACLNKKSDKNTRLIEKALFTTVTNVNFDEKSIEKLTQEINKEINEEINFDIQDIWKDENLDIRSLKSLILFGLKGIAAYSYHARILNFSDKNIDNYFYEALSALKNENSQDKLLKLVLKTGEINLKCIKLLDSANTKTFGKPEPTEVTMEIEKGPFIIISGHDLNDLKLLLEQTKDKGVNIYTHGEMLPCQAYPELKKYPHLKGNFGTAWQNQQKEFDKVPAPILFTTNCLMPPKESYKDRVFSTSVVEYPEIIHIDENKDFTPVINKALELKGYPKNHIIKGINGGNKVRVGFGHDYILSVADKILNLIKEKKINHIFLVGGCDGAKTGRNYYTNFVKNAPKDSLILTLACGKYRFNDLDLGEIDGIPRLIDMGQCNDAYSAINVAVELAKACKCEVNDLPLYFVLSWYEQKAVAILLTLLFLGIKNIYLGPSLPAFLSENILNVLVEKYNIRPISEPEKDLKELLN